MKKQFAICLLLLVSARAWAVCLPFNLGSTCGSGFVRIYPVTVTGADASHVGATGYLRISVTSSLKAIANNESFQHLDKGLKYLSVTVQVATGKDGNTPEFPVLLYDLENRSEQTVADYVITHAQFVNLDSGNAATITFHVRAIPRTIATAYLQAFKDFNGYVAQTPAKTLLTSMPQLAVATNVLNTFTSALLSDQNKDWHSTAIVGLSQKKDAILPVNDVPVILFLVPTAQFDASILGTGQFTADRNGAYRNGKAIDLPYLTVSAKMTDYRPLADLTGTPVACGVNDAQLTEIESVLLTTPLTTQQRDYERALITRARVAEELRNHDVVTSFDELATRAYELLSLPTPADDLWKNNFSSDAHSLEQCIQTTIDSGGPTVADRWRRLSRAMKAAREWETNAAAKKGDDQQAVLESAITDIVLPIKTYKLQEGEAYDYLTDTRKDIEQRLRPQYETVADSLRKASALQRPSLIADVNRRIASTDCASCVELLKAALDDAAAAELQAAQAALLAERKRAAELQAQLAERLKAATDVARAAQDANVAPKATSELQQTVAGQQALLGTEKPDVQKLQDAIKQVNLTTAAVQTELTKPAEMPIAKQQ